MRAIDADLLIDDCNKYLDTLNPDKDAKEYARIFWLISILKNAPTIEPDPIELERKKGKWIKITQGAIPEIYMCPFCNRTVKSIDSLAQIRYPFCHCGADMRGDLNE